MFERFTDRARHVVVFAQEEARRLNHNHIGTEHILVALSIESEGIAGRTLDALGVSVEQIREQIEEIVSRGQSAPSSHTPFTKEAKRALELSLREALQLGDNHIGTEHLLLGLIRQEDDVAVRILERLGTDTQSVEQEVHRTVMGGVGQTSSASMRKGLTVSMEEVSGDAPRCPRCYADLTRGLRVGNVTGTDDEEGDETYSLTLAWCPECGTVIGPVQ